MKTENTQTMTKNVKLGTKKRKYFPILFFKNLKNRVFYASDAPSLCK